MARQRQILVAASAVLLSLFVTTAAVRPMRAKAEAAVKPKASFERSVAPLVGKYCVTCHSGKEPPAGIALDKYHDAAAVMAARDVWQRVQENVSESHMPPEGAPQPTAAERAALTGWIGSTLAQADCQLHDPGRVTLRRLNREEYNNTVRDLLGVTLRPADEFPSDDVGYGFDNIGDVLSISPLLMEKYLSAAEKVARAAIVTPESRRVSMQLTGSQLTIGVDTESGPGSDITMLDTADAGVVHEFAEGGDYTVQARAYAQQAGPELARMVFILDAKPVLTVDVPATASSPGVYKTTMHLSPGTHKIAVGFVNDYYHPEDPNPNNRDRNLMISRLAIEGPVGPQHGHPLPRGIITCRPEGAADWDACARKVLAPFTRRAYRRPVTAAEVDRLVAYAHAAHKRGASFERSIQLAVEAVLVSPSFLFRVEDDTRPGAKRHLTSYEIATRLSYFLWSSMPDDTLFTLAAKDVLRDPKVLAAQVKRMLADKKADALTANFAGQWLQLRKLRTVAPDTDRFHDFDDNLRAAMRTESELYFSGIMREDRSILEFLDSGYTYLNGPLARHYGIDSVSGPKFRRVTLTGHERGGVITQASVLTVTSNPTRTSPVKRGRWVLEQLLGTPPPPPPPGVGQLPDDQNVPLTGTLRERMEQHRKNPACATCHMRMDPIGFGLENFDAVGGWRNEDGGQPIDSSGKLPGGVTFSGPAQLKSYLLTKKGLFVHALSEKMLTYALGRGLEPSDRCYVDAIARATENGGYRFSALMTAVVRSEPFLMRRSGR